MKWFARFVLAAIVAALFIPWRPVMVPLTEHHTNLVPFGVVILLVLGCIAACVGFALVVVWLAVQAGIIKGDD
jgi:hypothetical protein